MKLRNLVLMALASLIIATAAQAQIGQTWKQCFDRYGNKPTSWWHRDKVSYVQYFTPFWIVNLYFNGDIEKDPGATVFQVSFMTISTVEAGGFHPVSEADIRNLMDKNSFGRTWTEQEYTFVVEGKRYTGFETQHQNGDAFVLASPMGWNGSNNYSGVEFTHFSEYDNKHQSDPCRWLGMGGLRSPTSLLGRLRPL